MKPTISEKLESESLDMVPHEDRTNYYNTEGTDSDTTVDEVSQVAYNRFIDQGSIHGHDVEHWVGAEVLLKAARSKMVPQRK